MMTVSVAIILPIVLKLCLLLSISVIEVQFGVIEFEAEEEEGAATITFSIDNVIPVATHFIVHLMRYEEYDAKYLKLKEEYPALNPTALPNEYDRAECKFLID